MESAFADPKQERSLSLTTVDDTFSSQDINKDNYDYPALGIRNMSSYPAPLTSVESFLAPFLNNQSTPGLKDKYFCAQSEDDIKLIQILHYIKFCGTLDLLWNFIREHAELLTQQQTQTTCDAVRFSHEDTQYWLGEAHKACETRAFLCGAMRPECTRTGFTGSSTETKEMPDANSGTNDSNMKDDRIEIVDASSDTMSGCSLTPGTDFNCEDQMSIISADVKGAVNLQLGAEKNIGDSSLMNVVASETHWVRPEEDQGQQTGDQECPVWMILKKSECPFQWVPDVAINSIPCCTIQEDMITYLTGKPLTIIQAY
jgi:hypothetical protein